MNNLKRVVLHWTAGQNKPNNDEKEHYHYLIDGEGNITIGNHTPEDNIDCKDGDYAEAVGGGNTGTISIALCGMLGFENINNIGKYPLTKIQCETAFKLIAKLCKKYSITINPSNVLTHKEFGDTHTKTTSFGKIDISYFSPYSIKVQTSPGHFMREKVKWYFNNEANN